jgi:hypothetical protein
MYLLLDIFPLLLGPLLIYNMIVLTGIAGPRESVETWLAASVFTIDTFSGDQWHVSTGDILIFVGLVFLFVELVKATATDSMTLLNHGFSALTFILYLVQFLTMRGFSNSVIFALMIMSLIDVVGGYTITAVAARRDFGSGAAPK